MRRRIPLVRTVLLAVLLLGAAGFVALWIPIDRVVVARGVLAGGSTSVRAPLDARVERVLIRPGDEVRAGDPLLVLESSAIASERARAEARIGALDERARALEAQLAHLAAVGQAHERELAVLEVERSTLFEEAAGRRLAAQERLRDEKLVAEIAYEDARSELELARLAKKRAQLALEALPALQAQSARAVESELAQARRHLDELRLEAAELARREASATLTAPVAGVVLALAPQELAGRRVLAGEELLRLGHGAAERFEGRVQDLGRAHVREGMPVRLRVEGYPWLVHGSVNGRATFLGTRNPGDGFPVEVALEGERRGLVLREGMHASARILVEESVPLWRLSFERITGSP